MHWFYQNLLQNIFSYSQHEHFLKFNREAYFYCNLLVCLIMFHSSNKSKEFCKFFSQYITIGIHLFFIFLISTVIRLSWLWSLFHLLIFLIFLFISSYILTKLLDSIYINIEFSHFFILFILIFFFFSRSWLWWLYFYHLFFFLHKFFFRSCCLKRLLNFSLIFWICFCDLWFSLFISSTYWLIFLRLFELF